MGLLQDLSDAQLRTRTRILTVAAIALFVSSLALFTLPKALSLLGFGALLVAIVCALAAYMLTREDVRRHPVEIGLVSVRADDDRVRPEVEEEAVYALQAAGIPLSLERRSRWARKKG